MTNQDKAKPDLFKRLWDHMCLLHDQWAIYHALFGHSPQRVDVLNRRAGRVFGYLQRTLLDAIVLGICRLLDPKSTRGSVNISFERAIHELPETVDHVEKNALRHELAEIKAKLGAFLTQRHKRIAHVDRDVAMELELIPGISREMVAEAIKTLAGFYNRLLLVREDAQAIFDPLDRQANRDVDTLVRVLERGNAQLDAEQRARRRAYMDRYRVENLPQDFDPGDLVDLNGV